VTARATFADCFSASHNVTDVSVTAHTSGPANGRQDSYSNPRAELSPPAPTGQV
jgi:hypothetical protein